MKRSAKRTEFLNDILCAFAEGGIQMIGQIVEKEFDSDALIYRKLVVEYTDDPQHHTVTIDTIASGLAKCRKGPVAYLGRSARLRLNECYRECDAGEIDAVDATNIVEIGLFGEVVYS